MSLAKKLLSTALLMGLAFPEHHRFGRPPPYAVTPTSVTVPLCLVYLLALEFLNKPDAVKALKRTLRYTNFGAAQGRAPPLAIELTAVREREMISGVAQFRCDWQDPANSCRSTLDRFSPLWLIHGPGVRNKNQATIESEVMWSKYIFIRRNRRLFR